MEYHRRIQDKLQSQKLQTLDLSKVSWIKSEADKTKAANNIARKLEMYKDVEDNFKVLYKQLPNTPSAASAVSCGDTSIYALCVAQDFPTEPEFLKDNQIVEVVDTNYSRIYIDIDFHNQQDLPDFEKSLKLVDEVNLLNTNSISYAIVEYKPEYEEQAKELSKHIDQFILLSNSRDDFDKALSCHIYFNMYATREDIVRYTYYLALKFDLLKSSVFDCSVYKISHQMFRAPFSAKIIDNPDKTRKSERQIPEELYTHPDFTPEFIKNLRALPRASDIDVRDALDGDILDYEIEELEKQNQNTKQATTNKSKASRKFTQKDLPQHNLPSIFTYVKVDGDIKSIDDIMLNQPNNFNFASCYLPYIQTVLTPEQVEYEFKLLAKQLPTKILNTTYTEDDNKEFINKAYDNFKDLVQQDLTNMKTIYQLNKYASSTYEDIQTQLEDKDLKDEVLRQQLKEQLKTCSTVQRRLQFYIGMYEKESFVNHVFYDTHKDIEHSGDKKEHKIMYNVYTTIKDNQIVYPYFDRTFSTEKEFQRYFKLSGKDVKTVIEKLVAFENQNEFKLMNTPILYNRLPKETQANIENVVAEFLEIFKKSFKYESDYKFYLSWYSAKLNKRGTIYKGIINQGTENEGAKDSLKTFFNDMLEGYLNIISGDVNNLNKTLNGGYFMGDITCIEELPQHIKDIDNLVNVIKMYTSKEYLTLELKGANPIKKLNESDIVINTNHTVRPLFKNKNDCEALLKRFKILTRVSLDMSDVRLNEILDLFKQSEEKHFYRYILYKHIKEIITPKYFNEHKRDEAKIEELYKLSASEERRNNRIPTTTPLKDWVVEFKANYVDKQKRFGIVKFVNYLKRYEVYKNMTDDTFKQIITTMLLENDDKTGIRLKDKRLYFNKATDEAYKMIYEQFYEYNEPEEEQGEVEQNKVEDIEL